MNNLREIQALRRLSPHSHIILLQEVLYDQPSGRLALVFELMHANLYELIRGRRHYLAFTRVCTYMHQLLSALDHMHMRGIFHRDIKPENILINSRSDLNHGLKLADFGSCRGIYSKKPYTEYISTRWYRAPECLMTDGYYGPEMDIWGAGCVFFEITSLYPLFPGTNELDQIERIHKVLGTTPSHVLRKFKRNGATHVDFNFPHQNGIGIGHLINHAPKASVELMMKMLLHDPIERISAREALAHTDLAYMHHLGSNDLHDPSQGEAQYYENCSPCGAEFDRLPELTCKQSRQFGCTNVKKMNRIIPHGSLSRAVESQRYDRRDDRGEASASLPTLTGSMCKSGFQVQDTILSEAKKCALKRSKAKYHQESCSPAHYSQMLS